MKKIFITISFLFMSFINLYSQGIAFYDALDLKLIINANNGKFKISETSLKILKHYFDPTLTTDQNKLDLEIKNNQFLKEFYVTIGAAGVQNTPLGLTFANPATSIGGLDVTNIADGFAKFIVKRTKQELSIAFFSKFYNTIKKNEYKDLQTVFPQTYRALQTIGEEIYMFESYIQTLRECFEKDLASLPTNLPSIIENNNSFFNENKKLKSELEIGFYIAQGFQNKQHPGEIIEDFPVEKFENLDNKIKPYFQTLQLISESFKSNTFTTSYWAPYSDIKKLFTDDTLLKIYLGLLEQKAKIKEIKFNDDSKPMLWKIINDSYTPSDENLLKYRSFIKNIALKIQSLENKINSLKKIEKDSLLFENYYTLVSNSIDLMKYFAQVEILPKFPKILNLQDSINKYFDLAQTSCDIVIDVNRRNYSSGIVNSIHLFNDLYNDNVTSKAFFKYGSLMATIVQAKTSDEVEAAIESFALPTGSASIKRNTNFNVALNAYCGLYIGQEQIEGIDNESKWNSYGITAPIGITLSRGKSLFFLIPCDWFSSSFFISIIDIGAITAFRFNNDSTKSIPNMQLKDIISPGVFYSLGIIDSPLSINFGWQIGPILREITATEKKNSDGIYNRISISICVDIPLLNFYTSP